MQSAEIRRRWLRFFEERGHTVVPSASLIADDPTLLLVNAGMVPFKPYFLGEQTPPYPRATSVQKCVRTIDIDEVGKTTRHASFFQMAGNFSFGDYFKETAIPLAWELLTAPTAEGGYGLAEDRLWVTVYLDDDEAAEIWTTKVGLPAERVQRRGLADNYWHMGVPGPGGPCSEIYYDRGPAYGREGGPVADEERYLEVWNLVFMQYELSAVRGKEDFDVAGELPSRNIDTGLGLERLAAVLQGVENIYEIDTTRRVLDRAAELTGRRYGEAARSSIAAMAPSYPELERERGRIEAVATAEEASFLQTLRGGTTLFDTAAGQVRQAGTRTLTGEQAFQLHDTHGFPIDLTLEMAGEQGLTVDTDGFRRLMAEQRDRAKADARAKKTGHADVSAYRSLLDRAGPTRFTGYDEVVTEGVVRGLLADGELVPAAGEGDVVEIVLDRTPFYAESGGQLPDTGYLELANGAQAEVYDVQSPVPGLVVHRAKVMAGEVRADLGAEGRVDVERRRSISRSHTATHMVHKAFREALGETATQAGSENSPGRFRFDFASPSAVPAVVLLDVEQRVNELLAQDLQVTAEVMSQREAVESGAMALFGEKYGDEVRVVSVGDWARELCGGTHAQRSGQIGVVTLLGESSIGAGVRRVEALVSSDAYRFLAREHLLVSQLTDALKVRPEELPDRVATLVTRLREAEREIERVRAAEVLREAGRLAGAARDVYGVAYVGHRAPDGAKADDLRKLALDVRGRLGPRPAVVAAAARSGDRPVVVVAVNDAGREWGVRAGDLVRVAAQVLGGGGGGKDDVAQGGGTDPERIGDALVAVEHFIGRRVTGG